MEKLIFITPDTQEEVQFYIIELTRINGMNYLLVTESDEEETEAYILKDTSKTEESDPHHSPSSLAHPLNFKFLDYLF